MTLPPWQRILLVDDNPDHLRSLCCQPLRFIEVMAEPTGARAFDSLRRAPFDGVLVAEWLPDLPGAELCARLRVWMPSLQVLLLADSPAEPGPDRISWPVSLTDLALAFRRLA